MNILLANKFYYARGGDCIHTLALKGMLEAQGHRVQVFAMHFESNLSLPESVHWPKEVNFNSHKPVDRWRAAVRIFGFDGVQQQFLHLIEDFKPDVVHLQNIHSQLSPAIAMAAHQKGIPVVWTLHDYKLLCPAYTFVDHRLKVCEHCLNNATSVIVKRCIKGSILASIMGYLERLRWNRNKLQSFTSAFISPSLFLKEKMIEGGYSEERIQHIYNFAGDDKFLHKVKLKRRNTVLFVGRLSREKGLETLCKAFQNIRHAKLKIIGDGPLKKQLESRYASSQIAFAGYKQWDVLREELSRAACLAIPSEWYENNPLTVIEALAQGTPVVGACIGGIPELIQEGVNGFLFQPGNILELSLKIQKTLHKKDWHYQAIRKEAIKRFSQKNYYTQLMLIYQEAMSRRTDKKSS